MSFFLPYSILAGNAKVTIQSQINQDLGVKVEAVRLPYNQTLIVVNNVKAKSYIWWMDDPWAALIAMAAIIILLAIVGIIVIVFTHSR